ncbi:uncharacterized protein FIBRA_07384 [Fibroporia radiculosa]|uniref:F-box domain-containing protein n=1 Tax=Fibroporia radiculosa TaxID=599839 RepID=J4GUU6_9APHY|nr:uncharacterized protein FIBRA_07384 [Fibroporia radiculosa]CCM05175.1 predicted protein [Fibroporia radiculosa]
MPSVPPELSDYIVDYLYNDSRALIACSLVCRDWVATSRFHLFGRVTIDNARLCGAFCRLLKTSGGGIASYVRELIISKLSATDSELLIIEDALPPILALLHRAKMLTLTTLDLNPAIKRGLQLLPRSSTTELEVQYCHFPSFQDFAQLLDAFHHLEHLTVRGVSWSSTAFVPEHSSAWPIARAEHRPAWAMKLRSLTIGRDVDVSTFLGFLCSGRYCSNIVSLSVCCTFEEDADAVRSYLDVVGPSLNHLEVEWNPCHLGVNAVILPRDLSIENCEHLETLVLRCVILKGFSIPWVPALLSTLHSTFIQKIVFEIRVLGDLDALDWKWLDAVLSEPRFAHIEALVVKLRLWSALALSQEEARGIVCERFRLLGSRRILQFAS